MPSEMLDSDSDGVPEEITFEKAIKKDEEIKELQRENKARVAQEKKERRRLWAQRRMMQREQHSQEGVQRSVEDNNDDEHAGAGFLPTDIISFLASREKKVFSSDSEPEKETVEHDPTSRKKKPKRSKTNNLLLKNLPPPQCAHNSLDFLKKRKEQVPRSRAALSNADRALRLWASHV